MRNDVVLVPFMGHVEDQKRQMVPLVPIRLLSRAIFHTHYLLDFIHQNPIQIY